MKHTIVHLSDTHLGYSELDRVSPEGVNQRERDFYGSFEEIVNQIIERRPAAVVHTGDFFHRPSPANRPLIEGLRQLKRLSDEKIPVVVIAGNHSTPCTLYTSPILTAFQSVDGVYPIFRQKYETVEAGDFVFHGLPHIADERLYAEELEKVAPVEGRINVLMLHTSLGRDYIMEEYGERVFPSDKTAVINEFQYTALGHWHNFQQVGKKYPRAWYSGSTERLSDREAGSEKGYCVVRFDNPKEVKVDFQPVPVRPWRRYDIKDCAAMDAAEIIASLETSGASAGHDGALVSVYLHDLRNEQAPELANSRVARCFPGALSVAVKRGFKAGRWSGAGAFTDGGQSMEELFGAYLKERAGSEAEYSEMAAKAAEYFNRYETGE